MASPGQLLKREEHCLTQGGQAVAQIKCKYDHYFLTFRSRSIAPN